MQLDPLLVPAALVAALGPVGCPAAEAAPAVPEPPPPVAPAIEVGQGTLDAHAARENEVALCLGDVAPRLVLVTLPAGPAADLAWPLGPADRCQRIAIGDDTVCVAAYDAGIACAARDGGPETIPAAVDGAPTGLAWDGEWYWAATDGGGLWRFPPSGEAERVLDLSDAMSGLVAGPFGLVWGTAGEFTWRTRTLRRDATEPTWIRPPLPVNVRCEDEAEVCEWVSTALGWHRGRVWFAAANAPAPLYTWNPDESQWREYQVEGEVLVGPDGVWAVLGDGSVRRCLPNRARFDDVGVALAPGEIPVAAAGGLWAVGGGILRLVDPVR